MVEDKKIVEETVEESEQEEEIEEEIDEDELNRVVEEKEGGKIKPPEIPKTRAKKVTAENDDDIPTCPKCHKRVIETTWGWICTNCRPEKYYLKGE